MYMYTVVDLRGTWYVVRGTDHVVRRGMHIIHHTWYVVCHVTDVTYVYIIQEYRFIIIILDYANR